MAGAGSSITTSTRPTEREHIRKAIAAIQKMTGERPLGWYCRYGPSVNTRRLVVEEGGFLYDSDYYGEELPFWVTVDGKPQLVVPYSVTNNDGQFGSPPSAPRTTGSRSCATPSTCSIARARRSPR
jgi:peptidoglycan/xylan/chitin deacetylase (PgdA/CDA1 family)